MYTEYGVNVDKLLTNCDRAQQITTDLYSVRLFNAVMRAMATADSAVHSISYNCFLNVPVMRPGVITLYRDGRMVTQTRETFEKYGAPE